MQKQKNPLNVILGAFIQDERRKISNLSIEEICQKSMLGMSVSLYKMTEAGATSFNINRIPNLIRVFKDSDLVFDRLAKFIAGQNIIDNLMSNQDFPAQNAVAELADIDNEFKYLYEKIQRYFDLEEGTREFKDFIQSTAVNEVRLFLQNDKYPIRDSEMFEGTLVKEINKLPSLSLEILLGIVNSFAKISPQHFGHIAAEWERENKKIFTSVDGFYLNTKFIISPKNLGIYKYPYLDMEDFIKVRFIFHSPSRDKKKLLGDFKELLNANRDPLPIINDPVFEEKVQFETVSNISNDLKTLLTVPGETINTLQAFWVFTTKSGNKIAFVGVSGDDVNMVYNLTYEDALVRSALFEKIWNSIYNH